MRWVGVVLLVTALPALATPPPYVVLLEWTRGDTLAGGPLSIEGVTSWTFPLKVPACQREVLVDLLYAPAETRASIDGVGSITVPYEFHADLLASSGSSIGTASVRAPGYGTHVGTAPAAGDHALRLTLEQGANVTWELRVRGHAVFGERACLQDVRVTEVEANPAGADAGREWLEIHNADDEPADLSGWTVRATHGASASLTLAPGTTLAPGAFLRVDLVAGQFLDNANEVVELYDASGLLRDVTPALSDRADDGRTWQRATDGSGAWSFRSGTPGEANPP